MRACFLGQNICVLGSGVAILQSTPILLEKSPKELYVSPPHEDQPATVHSVAEKVRKLQAYSTAPFRYT
jgi:hypothetical protein